MRRFDGKIAVVTGAGHGIGKATALRLGSEGARVAILDLAHASETAAEVLKSGSEAVGLDADVTDVAGIRAAVEAVEARWGKIDILVNNAGYLRKASALDLDQDQWRRTFAVNVDGVLTMIQAVLPGMVARGQGAIVNIASVGGLFGVPGLLAYNASKGAVVNLTRQVAADYRRLGIRVNSVCPGMVPTGFNDPMLAGVSHEQLEARVDSRIPAGRQADPAEIAAVVAFLASEDASYVSGQAIVVDGGMTTTL